MPASTRRPPRQGGHRQHRRVAHCHRGEPHAHRYRAGADRRLGAEVLAQPGKVQRAEDGTDPEGAEHHAVEPGGVTSGSRARIAPPRRPTTRVRANTTLIEGELPM